MSCHKHARFLAKTVFVRNNDVDTAYKSLNRILSREKIIQTIRRKEYYEKPTQQRRRVSYERCKRIYNADMQRKIEFVMKVNRASPWL